MALTPPVVVPEVVAVSVTPLVGDVGSVLPDVVSPLANCVGMHMSIDSVEVSPLVVAGGGGAVISSDVAWPLLRWRPQPKLLGWRP